MGVDALESSERRAMIVSLVDGARGSTLTRDDMCDRVGRRDVFELDGRDVKGKRELGGVDGDDWKDENSSGNPGRWDDDWKDLGNVRDVEEMSGVEAEEALVVGRGKKDN